MRVMAGQMERIGYTVRMWPFGKKGSGESVAVIDIGSSSVGAALVYMQEGLPLVMCYSVRLPVEHKDPLTLTDRMLRTFTEVGERLVREGAPQLRTASGNGSIDRAVVSIGSPWQDARIETKTINPGAPFTFTKHLAVDTLAKDEAPEGRTMTQTVVATFLNGYPTAEPFGKTAKRAEIVVLSSSLETIILESIESAVTKLFHTKEAKFVGFADLCYSTLRTLYPHEKEFIVISVGGEATDVASIKRGHVVDVGAVLQGANTLQRALHPEATDAQAPTKEAWVSELTRVLRDLAMHHALPRTVFIIAAEEVRSFLKETLGASELEALWLSEEPVSIIAVEPTHFAPYLTLQGLAQGDTELSLLALYAAGK